MRPTLPMVWQTDFSEFETTGGIRRICAVIDYATKVLPRHNDYSDRVPQRHESTAFRSTFRSRDSARRSVGGPDDDSDRAGRVRRLGGGERVGNTELGSAWIHR
jgi:hypothetical protein